MSESSYRSYRDRHSGVRFEGDAVVRTFDDEGAEWFTAARDAGLLGELSSDGLIVDHEVRSVDPLVIESPAIPTITYPYEWTPSMLRDAGLLTLEIARRAWDAGFHIRDASAFNVVFRGGRPVMVDLGSFRPGHTSYFLPYGQFCDHFLNPLAVLEMTGISPRASWSSLEGISADHTRRIGRMKTLRPRYLRHIWARAGLERRAESMGVAERREVRSEYGLSPEAIRGAFDSLTSLLGSFDVDTEGAWKEYENQHSYAPSAVDVKSEFVRAVAERTGGRRAVDVGANTGRFSGLIAPYFETVVAIEPDEAAADLMYRRIREGDLAANVVPMVIDVLDPPAGRGLMNRERLPALERLSGADLVLWLAVIHHLVLSRNVPMPMVLDMALHLSDHHVFEYVSEEDEMAQLLLSARDESPWPMDLPTFEAALGDRFRILEAVDVNETRRLYEVVAL